MRYLSTLAITAALCAQNALADEQPTPTPALPIAGVYGQVELIAEKNWLHFTGRIPNYLYTAMSAVIPTRYGEIGEGLLRTGKNISCTADFTGANCFIEIENAARGLIRTAALARTQGKRLKISGLESASVAEFTRGLDGVVGLKINGPVAKALYEGMTDVRETPLPSPFDGNERKGVNYTCAEHTLYHTPGQKLPNKENVLHTCSFTYTQIQTGA